MISIIYYAVISLLAVLLLISLLKKRPWPELVSLAVILVTFGLRALHIK